MPVMMIIKKICVNFSLSDKRGAKLQFLHNQFERGR